MVGDVNIPYCQNQTLFEGYGCIWWASTFSPAKQLNSLQVYLSDFDQKVIQLVQQDKLIAMVSVLLSGRPMIINELLSESSAFISGFLPGTSGGQGIVDAIFGSYTFRANGTSNKANSLSFDWPKSMDSLRDFPYYSADG